MYFLQQRGQGVEGKENERLNCYYVFGFELSGTVAAYNELTLFVNVQFRKKKKACELRLKYYHKASSI